MLNVLAMSLIQPMVARVHIIAASISLTAAVRWLSDAFVFNV